MAKAKRQHVVFKTPYEEFRVQEGTDFLQTALSWSYIAYNRQRWRRSKDAGDLLAERCCDLLDSLGINEGDLNELASAPIVEIRIPDEKVDESAQTTPRDNPARIMPWEFILGKALSEWEEIPLIVRHLEPRRKRRAVQRSRPKRSRPLLVIGAQASLEPAFYSFDSEIELLSRIWKSGTYETHDLLIEELKESVRDENPDVIHLAGVDSHHGVELFKNLERSQWDGMLFTDEDEGVKVIRFDELATALTSGNTMPSIVVFNTYHSAPRLAAETVARGAKAALGFQDTCDDIEAERFIGQFYRAWKRSRGNVLVSALVAYQDLKNYTTDPVETGVVLWSDRSLLDGDVDAILKSAERVAADTAENKQPSRSFQSRETARKQLPLIVEPIECLNYALLHNREPMFTTFALRNLDETRTVSDVHVEVELLAGPESSRFSSVFEIGNAPVDLGSQVFVPLTSTLSRGLTESIRAALRIRMSVGKHLGVYEQTHRVTLLPVDEWKDSNASRQWLPSFVFPKDPAVRRIVDTAAQYLAQLTDITSSGFDGYQVYDGADEEEEVETSESETAESENDDTNFDRDDGIDDDEGTGSQDEDTSTENDELDPADALDSQVEAIWTALIYSFPLRYINPPPTYTELSQRLRSPSEVLDSKHGTCIDLALLLTAALEYVDIFPVVFLLEGHAFPGYWRSDRDWENFMDMTYVTSLDSDKLEELLLQRRDQPQPYPWVFPDLFYTEIRDQVEAGKLVPLEAVALTYHGRFTDAQEIGWENLSEPDEFHSMIDIRTARESGVTPLPKIET